MKSNAGAGHDVDEAEFRLEEFLPYRLSVASSRVSRVFARRYADAFGLTISEWRMLTTVGRFGAMSPSAVADKTAMDKVKVSRAASALTARGLVRQSKDADDGRAKRLQLTRKGINAYRDIVALARETEASIASGVTLSEWATLNRVLAKLDTHMIGLEAPDAAD